LNTAHGANALASNTIGSDNTASGEAALFSNTTGDSNTANGVNALLHNTGGSENTASGFESLKFNNGSDNTASGYQALLSNTTGAANTATGVHALQGNTTGQRNTATGVEALKDNTTGDFNTVDGADALFDNTVGSRNTASGFEALEFNTEGDENTASGYQALQHNTTGEINTANGVKALLSNTTGRFNTATGFGALVNNTTGSGHTVLGENAGYNIVSADNVICIGAGVDGLNVSNTTWIGNVYNVHPQNTTTNNCIVSADGQLGVPVSSERFKKDIATMEKASDAILSLRPVTFHYKTDTEDVPQFGLIAEEVAKVNPALVLPDKEGKPYSVRYDAVNAMILNEFLKAHRKVESLEKAMAEQQKENAAMRAMLKAQAAQIQKVSAQIVVSKAAPQTVIAASPPN